MSEYASNSRGSGMTSEANLLLTECLHETAYRHAKSFPDCDCERCLRAAPRPLPTTSGSQRPVWEPPIFSYYEFINEEYEKKREAVLEYTNGDRGRTTEFLDCDTETMVLFMYERWLRDARNEAGKMGDEERERFWEILREEIDGDYVEQVAQLRGNGFWIHRNGKGDWKVWDEERAEEWRGKKLGEWERMQRERETCDNEDGDSEKAGSPCSCEKSALQSSLEGEDGELFRTPLQDSREVPAHVGNVMHGVTAPANFGARNNGTEFLAKERIINWLRAATRTVKHMK